MIFEHVYALPPSHLMPSYVLRAMMHTQETRALLACGLVITAAEQAELALEE